MPDDSASVLEFVFPTEIWGPISNLFSSSMTLASSVLFWLAVVTVGATYIIYTKDIPGAWNPSSIAIFILINALVLLLVAWWLSPLELPYVGEVLSSAPNSCIGEYGSSEGTLCYRNCRAGYHGVGVRCWADSVGIGLGKLPGWAHKDAVPGSWCPKDWHDDGLLCRAPLGWNDHCVNWGFGNWSGCATGGQIEVKQATCPPPSDFGGDYLTEYWKWRTANEKGDPVPGETLVEANAANHKTCADVEEVNDKHWDNVDGTCYKPCPKDNPVHVPMAPYQCYKGGDVSYDRGAGRIPPAFRLLRKYAINIPPHAPVDNTPM